MTYLLHLVWMIHTYTLAGLCAEFVTEALEELYYDI